MRIGVFDSGVGGLTVLKEIHREIPGAHIIYVGDTARVPYGTKSKQAVVRYSLELASFLMEWKVHVLVVACNTASSHALSILRDKLPIEVIGVIEPGVRRAVSLTRNGRVGVIGTPSTVNSGAYQRLLSSEGIEVFAKACPLFVPLVEEGLLKGKVVDAVIEHYLAELKEFQMDTLILGCTHYPLLREAINEYLEGVEIVDSASVIAQDLKSKVASPTAGEGKLEIFFTDISPNLGKLVQLIVGKEVDFQLADLEEMRISI